MKRVFSKVAVAFFSIMALFSTASFALVITDDLSVAGTRTSPGQINWTLWAPSGPASLAFDLAGYRSLDGYNNNYTDIFHLWLNGTEIFTGSFNMGGGGWNTILFNPNGGTAVTTTYGATDDIHNSHQVTWAGGLTQIALPINLLLGANELVFSYTGWGQPPTDEWWGVNLVSVTTKTQVSESSSMFLLAIGLLGIFTLRRKSFYG
ncbi:hypothetical protein GCM10011613_30790 [Cellvibrio zantedeschiae]|uniref:PEP-CTERM protein-sorting domain-containing protein n=1 Tax=Cellvibrio zantedeschiae TaxID=1237077 RepID=A0ABQ3BC72_9GAMM|nr:PEP-CTERM sorting domain-containing protein [Cellvibrio zantedeschiae]GGY83726.1 hypothetical protein GCM10011613_30790 [Cellvibrio zantedeschiae]